MNINIDNIIAIRKGKKPQSLSPNKSKGFMPYVDIKAFEKGIIENYTNDEKCLPCNDGDLLIVCDGSRSGLVGKAIKGYVGSTLARIDYDKSVDRDYLFYYIQSKYQMLNTQKKGTGTPHLNAELLKNSTIYLPSLADQHRIVTKIEELFSQLDSGVETLKKTKQQLAVYRQAVLKEAFEGKFTESWRKTHSCSIQIEAENHLIEKITLPYIPDEWKWVSIGDISSGVEYGTSSKSEKAGKVPVIRMGNLQGGVIDWSDLAFTSDYDEIKKYRLKSGDVLFNRTNSPELVGKTAIYKGEREAIFAGYLIRINQKEFINPQYLTYYMNGFTAKQYGNLVKTDGVNQSNINGKKLCSYPFPLCSIEEQERVVYELESRLSVCDSIEKTVDEALQQAEALRQSILKKAFEGELI